jgi:Asp-tRNA(Asn)/Glu-tRNA(Gln) amidotransferase A subunit family amidase
MTAAELVRATRSRQITCVEATAAGLERMQAGEALGAWVVIDAELALAAAAELDRAGPGDRALFGLPVGVKDIFDTADLPTSYGSPLYAGHRPRVDAAAVAALRRAGAVIIGKTATTEFATLGPSAVANPLRAGRTPGGSSSGSAAAVGAGMVPVALGTQTAGSIIRPASYCAVIGYKPTFGAITRVGVLPVSQSLDTVGLFARNLPDARLLARVLIAADPGVPTVRRTIPVRLAERADDRTLRLGFARTPQWGRIDAAARAAIEHALAGHELVELSLPAAFDRLIEAQQTVQLVETAQALERELCLAGGLGDELAAFVADGLEVDPEDYARARRDVAAIGWECRAALAQVDAAITPSTTGTPPPGPATGDPLFCRAWTAIGAPCVAVPLAWADDGLPVGLQVVAAPGADDLALAAAEMLVSADCHTGSPSAL